MNYGDINRWLIGELESLDISPTNYKKAVDRYKAVGVVIENYLKERGIKINIYTQGSFMLGTVVKPFGKEKEYDIDLVCECEVDKQATSPKQIKQIVGDALKNNGVYSEKVDDEGRRCWTVIYSEDNDLGFHIDVLPSVPSHISSDSTEISTTTRVSENVYEWDKTDPTAFYYKWFKPINDVSFNYISRDYKTKLFESNKSLYASIEDVPDQLVRTKLQRLIQALKRHRDIRFENSELKDYKPMSMIITIMATKVYQTASPDADLSSILTLFSEELYKHRVLLSEGSKNLELPLISKKDGKFVVENPVVDENLAERWDEDNGVRAKAFFGWIEWLKRDITTIRNDIYLIEKEEKRFDTLIKEFSANTYTKPKSSEVREIKEPVQPWK